MPRHSQSRFVTVFSALAGACVAAVTGAACNEYDVSNLRGHDIFWQIESDVVADLLFVIDNSASMNEEQELLGTSFSAFVEAIEGTISDLQIGVTTTDVDHDEAGQLTAPLMTANDPDLATLTEDHESLRKHLQIDKWLVYGSGGWSSAAALHYAKTYPDRTLGLVLQGVVSGSGSKEEVRNLFTRSGFMRTCIASFEANVAGRVSAVARRREWEQEHITTRGAAAALQHMWYG